MISQEAKVCRRSCQLKSLTLAISSAVWNPFLTSLTGSPAWRPVACANTYGQSGRRSR